MTTFILSLVFAVVWAAITGSATILNLIFGFALSTLSLLVVRGEMNARGYWPSLMTTTSNPYIGEAPAAVTGGEYQTTRVGDLWDTSPYTTDYPVECVSTQVFIRNMGELIEALEG